MQNVDFSKRKLKNAPNIRKVSPASPPPKAEIRSPKTSSNKSSIN
jgi:hypothetical protein